ncbi:MAG: Bax inhibitor-1 family protein [Pirellulaceae bacterium]|nr:Bax inhibitor-1 family protein [Pirellulaceae bacterium]
MRYAQSNTFPAAYAEQSAAHALESDRIGLIQRTYLHLGLAILAFVGLECIIFTAIPQVTLEQISMTATGGWNWLFVLGGVMGASWIANRWAESGASRLKQYLGLLLFVAAEAVIFVPLLAIAQFQVGGSVIESAALTTLVTFGGLTAVLFIGRFDFSFMRMFLLLGGILAMGLILCSIFFGLNIGTWFSVAMVGLPSGYILYHTSNVLHHYRTDQDVAAALALFSSVATLFYYILILSMRRD